MTLSVTLLGTNGGPRVNPKRWAPSQVITLDGEHYVVDCGDGVARRLVDVGVALDELSNIFITHHHSDHNAGYGPLLLLSWATGLSHSLDIWGPPPLKKMTEYILKEHEYDINIRMKDEGRPPLAELLRTHEITGTGVIYSDAHKKLTVTACLVEHPPIDYSYAYRFDSPDRSIVVSGDTRPCDSLVELAKGADILIHEVLYPDALDTSLFAVPNAPELKQHLLASHTSIKDVGKIAADAGVKKLVLSHLVPGSDAISDQMWLDALGDAFKGEVVIGKDLMEV